MAISSPSKIDRKMRGGGSSSRRPGTRDFSPNPSDMKDTTTTTNHRSERPHRNNPFPHRPPPRRSLTPPSRSRPGRERRDHAPFAEEDNYSFPTARKYMLDRQADETLPRSKPSLTETEYRHQGLSALQSASSGLRGQGLVTRSSIFNDDADVRKFYTDTGYLSSTAAAAAAALKSDNLGGGGFHESDVLRYDDRPRDPYDERDKEKIHTKDTSFSLISSSTRGRAFGGTSSSSFAKDDLLELYRDRPHPLSGGFSRDFGVTKLTDDPLEHRGFGVSRLSDDPLEARGFGVSKLPDDPLERNGYGQELISDPVRHAPLSPTVRYAPRDYTYYDLDRSKMIDQGFLAADNAYKKAESGNHGDYRTTLNSTSFMNLAGDRVERADALHKNSTESSVWDRHRSLHGDTSLDYRDMRMVREDYVRGFGSGRDASRVKLSRDNEVVPFEERYALTREGAMPMAYRDRPRNPSHGVSRVDNTDMYDLSPERIVRRKYAMDDDAYQIDSRDVFPNDLSAFRRLRPPSGSDEMRTIEDRLEFPPSKRPVYRQRQRRMPANRMPRSDGRLQYADSSAHAGRGRGISLKRRLRPGPSEFLGSFPFERRNDFNKPNKFWKRDNDYHHANQDTQHEHTYDDPPPVLKTDPPEDSEEFKHQIQKAFLRYSKVLNENPHQQKKYLEQGKAGSLVCCVCGSLSKEFMDTHSLVTHTYNSLKVGLKTEHRGLHKALCTLMGWKWLVPPDTAKVYQSSPVAEAKALKEDLILWPPVVIIHNSSIGNKINANGAKVLTIEGMTEILRDMGFEAEKTQVGQGKPANQSVLLVKFMPTFSGLQEAERLHKHYADNHRGRQEYHQITSAHSNDKVKEAHVEKVEELLYGYMAVAEDLDKLDPGTKKRCLVKSRKDIKAIADAPLNMD